MNNKLSVKHHCIPQFYLNRFGTKQKNGSHQIFVYNKNNNAFFKNSVSNIGYIKNYNTIEIDSEKTDEFEKLHNQVFERKYGCSSTYARWKNYWCRYPCTRRIRGN